MARPSQAPKAKALPPEGPGGPPASVQHDVHSEQSPVPLLPLSLHHRRQHHPLRHQGILLQRLRHAQWIHAKPILHAVQSVR